MRIVAGTARGRRLVAPRGERTRPTSDRVRESVFNILTSLGGLEDLVVLDLFAGSGAMALEALSRGAAGATAVERDPGALAAIRRNVADTGLGPLRVVHGDVHAYLASAPPGADLIFCDPPYDFEGWESLLGHLPGPRAVVESNRDIAPGPGWRVLRARRYGGTVVEVLERET